jgi:hypothetical protein
MQLDELNGKFAVQAAAGARHSLILVREELSSIMQSDNSFMGEAGAEA